MICGDTPSYGWVYSWLGWWVGSGQITKNLINLWPNWDNSILFEDLWFVGIPPSMGKCMGGWVNQWLGSCQITKNWINLDLIEIFQFCFEDLWFMKTPPPMDGCMGGWLGRWVGELVDWWVGLHQISKNWINCDLIEIIQFNSEYLWFVETPSPMGGYMGVLMDGSFLLTFDFLLKPPQPITELFFLHCEHPWVWCGRWPSVELFVD